MSETPAPYRADRPPAGPRVPLLVAEGVETQQQAELLTELGCDELQGYLYAPALDEGSFAALAAQPLRAALAAEA